MSSKTEIFNLALGIVGAERILSPSDENKRAQVCRDTYNLARNASLEGRLWSFATKKVLLNPDPIAPEYDFGFRFLIPSDSLRVVKVDSNDQYIREIHWELADGYVECDYSPIKVKYIYAADESKFSPNFAMAVAYKLAAEICIPLSKNIALRPQFLNDWTQMLSEAATLDGMQGKREQLKANRLVGSRSGGVQHG
jgi:hypothetical protein